MAFSDLPTELLLNILSFLDNLDPLSSANHTLSTTIRDYQASQLRGRLAKICNAEMLVSIWSPPYFFRRNSHGKRPLQPIHVSRPQDLINVLCDPGMIPRVEAYISNLEDRAWLVHRVAEHLISLVDFGGFRSSEDRMSYASVLVIHLWSAEQRYRHDTDGYIASLPEGYIFSDLCARDQYLLDLPVDTRGWLVACYNALSQHLRPPFVPRGSRGEGMWLQRAISRGGMQAVLTMLEKKGGRR